MPKSSERVPKLSGIRSLATEGSRTGGLRFRETGAFASLTLSRSSLTSCGPASVRRGISPRASRLPRNEQCQCTTEQLFQREAAGFGSELLRRLRGFGLLEALARQRQEELVLLLPRLRIRSVLGV